MSRSRFRPAIPPALALALAVHLGIPGRALAHEVRPGYLEIRETDAGRYHVLWKQPAAGEMRLSIDPVFPDSCSPAEPGSQELTGVALLLRTELRCEGGLSGKTIAISGLEATLTDVVVAVHYRSGASETHLLRPAAPSVVLDSESSTGARALAFLRIGIEHILMGVDHLLFVLGLLLIVKNRTMLLKTITSFTVAHSITLALATLGIASAPVAPLNAAIALSILFLGPEIVRSWRGETSFTIRHPWVVAFAFGLLHGFGFASGLTSMGLPSAEIPLALLLFNVGVELGQLFFVLVIVLLERSFRTLEIRWPRFVESLPGYTVGTLGAFWTVQRTAMLLGWKP
jgi:hydrogenase/urease accessory protein HupE